jgi:hypothetical protein
LTILSATEKFETLVITRRWFGRSPPVVFLPCTGSASVTVNFLGRVIGPER